MCVLAATKPIHAATLDIPISISWIMLLSFSTSQDTLLCVLCRTFQEEKASENGPASPGINNF